MANPTTGTAQVYQGPPVNVGTFINFTATTTGTQVKTGIGALYSITFNSPVATGVVTLYDGTSTSGTKIGTITVPASPQAVTVFYDIYFAVGLFVVIATAAQDLTISYH